MNLFRSGNPNSMMLLGLLNNLEASGYLTKEDKEAIISIGEDCLSFYGRYPKLSTDKDDDNSSCDCGGNRCIH